MGEWTITENLWPQDNSLSDSYWIEIVPKQLQL